MICLSAKLYMLKEVSEFMMSFVIITSKNNCIVIDGGRKEDIPQLAQRVDGRHISAWILTHPHSDHISGFIYEMDKNSGADFDIERVYYNFPDYDTLINLKDVPDREYFISELNDCLPEFNKIRHKFRDKEYIVEQGESVLIDDVKIEFIYSLHDGLYANLMNDASLVFKIIGPMKTVLFLGDLGPDGGDVLFRESSERLKSDIVQMAHHGHMNVSMEVYAKILPKVCLWCAPDWLYAEEERPQYLSDAKMLRKMGRIRMYGTALTREWMNLLGAEKHYVSSDGTQEIEI